MKLLVVEIAPGQSIATRALPGRLITAWSDDNQPFEIELRGAVVWVRARVETAPMRVTLVVDAASPTLAGFGLN